MNGLNIYNTDKAIDALLGVCENHHRTQAKVRMSPIENPSLGGNYLPNIFTSRNTNHGYL